MTHSVLLVGAAGWLGAQVLDALHERKADVRILLRGGMAHPKAAQLAAKARVIAGDLADPDSLDQATAGVHTIISTVQGGPDVVVDGQVALARAGLANGVARILPSDFSVDIAGVTPDRHLFLGWRAEADRQIGELGLPQINVLNGAFTEMLLQPFFGLMDKDTARIAYWGDPDQPYDFTTTADVADAVAVLALGPARAAGPAMIAGDTKTPRELAARASAAYGQPFALDWLGSLEDLDAEISARQARAPNDPGAWAGLQYHRLMANGQGRLTAISNPDIGRAWTGVEAFLKLG